MGKEILNVSQRRFLEFVQSQLDFGKGFYLTGGTALSAYYLNHRYSEDLDFFSEKEIDLSAINVFLRKAKSICGIKTIDFEQAFNRNIFFLTLENRQDTLKVEFTYYPFTRLGAPLRVGGLFIDSILDIAVNKVFTIAENPRARDFIDVYFILQKKDFSFKELLKKARLKFDWHVDPLQFGSQLLKAEEVEDYPRMLKAIEHKKWQEFFIKEAKKFKKDTLKFR